MNNIKQCVKKVVQETSAGKKYFVRKALNTVVNNVLIPADQVRLAENDLEEQARLLTEQMKKCPQKATEMEMIINNLLRNNALGETDKERLKQDMLYSYFAYGYTPNEYVCYEFWNKNLSERRGYVSDRESVRFAYRVNDRSAIYVFVDKMTTYMRFKKYYCRDAISISNKKDYAAFCEFISKHPVFVKKIVNESCGRSVELIDSAQKGQKALFADILAQGKTILEEPIRQHPKMATLNRSSVNTIRCLTLNTVQGILIPWCFIKVGRAGSFVDNGGAGGILIGIDPDTGIISTDGYDETNQKYEVHPDSGVHFQGFVIPEWEAMKEICIEMASQIPTMGWIGWDMAYSENGWVVVEGNALSEVIGPQATFKKGIRAELTRYMPNMKAYYPDSTIDI